MMMKINKSKRQLAQLLIEVGVTKFPDGANWAAQDESGKEIYCYKNKPRRPRGWRSWHHDGGVVSNGAFQANALMANWHQTVLSRDEFDQIVAETAPDADGWIEWKGGECPVDVDALVCCKWRSGKASITAHRAGSLSWRHNGSAADIIAYRLHKQEQAEPQYCESVTRSIPEPATAPTLDQLLQDWRNADDYAKRKQAEADEAASMRDERWKELQARAGEMGVTVGLCESVAHPNPELVITDWRDLQLNDIIEYVDGNIKDKIGMTGPVVEFAPDATDGMMVRMKCDSGPHKGRLGWPMKWRFIRRP